MIRENIPLAGVIGSPIAHSRSPQLHGYWLNRYNIAGFYVPMNVAAGDLETVLRTLPRAGFVGVNVTIPHKEAALRIADETSETARSVGAANTLTFLPDGRIHADNTDGYGFMANLRQAAPSWKPTSGPALVLGAGGAARAVIVALLDAGVPEIYLANRTRARAEELRAAFGPKITVTGWKEARDAVEPAHLIVNTTSLGMTGKPPLETDFAGLQPRTLVTDLVYAPLRTGLLETAAARGCATVDGLGMLLHQGVPGFERWFGQRPDVTGDLRDAVLG